MWASPSTPSPSSSVMPASLGLTSVCVALRLTASTMPVMVRPPRPSYPAGVLSRPNIARQHPSGVHRGDPPSGVDLPHVLLGRLVAQPRNHLGVVADLAGE